MFKKQEIGTIILASLAMGFVISFKELQTFEVETLYSFLKSAGFALITVLLCMIASKIAAYKFGCGAEFRLWTMERYGFHKRHYVKRPIPTWLAFPLFLVFISWGTIKWLALLVFDIAHTTRALGKTEYSEVTEWELGLIAFYGLLANIALAIISKFAGWSSLASLNIWFVFFNLLPFSELNGMKILNGSKMLWIFIVILSAMILILLGMGNFVTVLIAAVAFALLAVVAFFHFFER